ncbi:MAG TPA: DUF5995 family protein [Lacibacter sp.]|nr:DUF5995 family protein [Lacibacter sp.]HMO90437.1 DUF5995 family protein [Lacibacter sp.]HMO90546.1 DUF5995 family protein [Lacibacter sp.]
MQTIDQVLERLDAITDACYRGGDCLGIFSAVYRRTTAAVQEAISAGRFEDPQRLEHLDVVFALRYLEAYDAYCQGVPASRSWTVAFEAARQHRLGLMQHLLLGMNAHILLDLGIAAAAVCPRDSIYSLERDFRTINEVLVGLIDEVQADIGRHSPVWRLLDRAGWRLDETLVAAGIRRARHQAWQEACALAFLEGDEREQRMALLDARVARQARHIVRGPLPARPLLWLIRKTERNPLQAIPHLTA